MKADTENALVSFFGSIVAVSLLSLGIGACAAEAHGTGTASTIKLAFLVVPAGVILLGWLFGDRR